MLLLVLQDILLCVVVLSCQWINFITFERSLPLQRRHLPVQGGSQHLKEALGERPWKFLSTFGGHCLHCLHLHITLATGPWIDSFLPFLSFVFPVKPDAGDMVLSLLPELVAFFPFLVIRGWHRRHYGEQRGENLMMNFKLFF